MYVPLWVIFVYSVHSHQSWIEVEQITVDHSQIQKKTSMARFDKVQFSAKHKQTS